MISIKELRKAGTKRKDPIYAFMDYLAYYPAKLFLYTSLTANQITVIWIIGQIIAALFLTSGDYLTMVIALVAFQAMFVLDCTDGIIARHKKQFTLNGIYLDYIGHYIANPLLFICLGIGIANITHNVLYVFLGGLTAIIFLLNKAITLNPFWYGNPDQKKKIEDSYNETHIQKKKGLLFYAFVFLRVEYFFNLMFWGILFGYAEYTLMLYTLFFFLELLRKMFSQLIHNHKLDKN